jgi:hypothetical protein
LSGCLMPKLPSMQSPRNVGWRVRTQQIRATAGATTVARVGRVSDWPPLRDLWRRGQRGWPASFPLAQFPNGLLLAALGALVVATLTDGSLRHYARAAFYAALAAWAWDELARGTNWVRRALGVAGLFYVIVKVGAALGA